MTPGRLIWFSSLALACSMLSPRASAAPVVVQTEHKPIARLATKAGYRVHAYAMGRAYFKHPVEVIITNKLPLAWKGLTAESGRVILISAIWLNDDLRGTLEHEMWHALMMQNGYEVDHTYGYHPPFWRGIFLLEDAPDWITSE